MKAKDLEFLEGYLERLTNTRRLVEMTWQDKNAPVDAVLPLEGALQKAIADNRDKLVEILVRETVERLRKEDDDGR